MARIVTFGEIMARMAPAGLLRLAQVLPGNLDVTFAGAEANVAAALAMLEVSVDFVTALPRDSPLTQPCLGSLRGSGVGVQRIQLSSRGRFGVYFVESGANQRPSRVYYDREHSAVSLADPDSFPWSGILDGDEWLHLTGITPGLSRVAAQSTLHAAQAARSRGVRVSFDVNFRSKLWRWDPDRTPLLLARDTLRSLLPYVDLLFAGEEDLRLLGLESAARPRSGAGAALPVLAQRSLAAALAVTAAFPNIHTVASSLRIQHSASHNDWGGFLYDAGTGQCVLAPLQGTEWVPYEIRNIVDRVGAGDAFDAGILYGLSRPGMPLQAVLDFATAAACLAHSIVGDWNFASRGEIEDLIGGAGSGRIIR